MNKQELLKKTHALIWKDDDMINQDELWELQTLIDTEILEEVKKGTMIVEQLSNGYLKKVEITKGGINV